MNTKYNQPTAHMLQPVKGWDSMAHLDFVAPINSSYADKGYFAGTVMHLDNNGTLKPGLESQSVAMFLFYKQDDEDTRNPNTTEDGIKITSLSFNSFGGYNSEVNTRGYTDLGTGSYTDIRNGGASNMAGFSRTSGNAVSSYAYSESSAAHTTYPSTCGMELSSTEFAQVNGSGTSLLSNYKPGVCLTSPKENTAAVAASNTSDGTLTQQLMGGFLKKGTAYLDPICGVVSKKPDMNEHGYRQIYFWAVWLPAIASDQPSNNETLKFTTADGLNWA